MTKAGSSLPTGRHQRKLKNYLLDPHFQFKYSSYLVAIAVVLSGLLGAILWRTSEQMLVESQKNVEQGQRVVEFGRKVVAESRKVSEVVKMNIVKDPVYQENPELLEAFTADAGKREELLGDQEKALVNQAKALENELLRLQASQTRVAVALFVLLGLLVFGVFVAGIIVTHKVAGPIYKMKRQLREVGEGHLRIPGKLRKGDELVAFFDTFEQMVRSLRGRQESEIAMLESAIKQLEGRAEPAAMTPLHDLHREMKAALDT